MFVRFFWFSILLLTVNFFSPHSAGSAEIFFSWCEVVPREFHHNLYHRTTQFHFHMRIMTPNIYCHFRSSPNCISINKELKKNFKRFGYHFVKLLSNRPIFCFFNQPKDIWYSIFRRFPFCNP